MKRSGAVVAVCAVGLVLISGCSEGATEQPSSAPVSTGSKEVTPSPSTGVIKDARYGTVAALKEAAVLAGLACPDYVKNDVVKNAAESAWCSPTSVLMTFATDESLAATVRNFQVDPGSSVLLVGPNWIINDPESTQLQSIMGGVVERGESPTAVVSTELNFGEALPLADPESGDSVEVTLGTPAPATCQYSSMGCAEPETADRVVQIPITIENTGSKATDVWGRRYFVLESPDGTVMKMDDGVTEAYFPDNAMDYGTKIKRNSRFTGVLVFEAPKGSFRVLILPNQFFGEPLAAWS